MMRYIGFLLNAYQPPTQPQKIVQEIYRTSYEPVIEAIEENPHIFLSLDIARSLGERLPKEFLERIASLCRAQRIELVNTAAYHFLLPLVPEHTACRQLALNLEFYRASFTKDRLSGVFLPELAFSHSLAGVVKSLGFSWLVADDQSFVFAQSRLPEERRIRQEYCPPQTQIPLFNGCRIILRSSFWSEQIAQGHYDRIDNFAKYFLNELAEWQHRSFLGGADTYIVLVMDWETFGHHHQDAITKFLLPFFENLQAERTNGEMASLEYIAHHFDSLPLGFDGILLGSWATSLEDFHRQIPFPLWANPHNEFHRAWNEFMQIVFAAAPENPSPELQEILDKAFYSCPPWWACRKKEEGRDIAGWCLPYFKRIMELLPQGENTLRLSYLLGQMEHFVAT